MQLIFIFSSFLPSFCGHRRLLVCSRRESSESTRWDACISTTIAHGQSNDRVPYTMAEEALRRAKAIAAKWNQTGGQGNDDVASAGSALESENSNFRSGDRGASGKRPNNFVGNSEKIFVPVNERRDIQWVGLICGPRGSNIARIREASNGCEVKLRGKGSTRDGQNEGNEDLHVLLEGTNAQIDIARGMINDLLENPDKVKATPIFRWRGVQDIPMAKEDDPTRKCTFQTPW